MSAGLYERALAEACVHSPEVVVLTAENRAHVRGLPALLGDRFIDVGICEQTLVGAAAGLALRGRRPVAHALAAFLTMRAFEFVRTDVGIARLPVTLVGYLPGLLSEANGPTHQALEDLALMRGIPGMSVVCPADMEETAQAISILLARPRPAYVRYVDRPAAVVHRDPFVLGRAEWLARGRDVVLLVAGALLREAGGARALLCAAGVSVGLVNMRTLAPLDEAAVRRACTARLVVTVEDHFESGGLFTAVAELVAREGLRARIVPLAFRARWFAPGPYDAVVEHEGLTAVHIAERVEGEL